MSCICQCKDTNFKANHNFSNTCTVLTSCCICQCKDTNFKANHNVGEPLGKRGGVVFANAKILILKLITTVSIL